MKNDIIFPISLSIYVSMYIFIYDLSVCVFILNRKQTLVTLPQMPNVRQQWKNK